MIPIPAQGRHATPVQDASPGRACPLHYRYSPSVFAASPEPGFGDCEVVYVVGGLYGNEPSLDRILDLYDGERGRKRMIFNGDFHWFDVDPDSFGRIHRRVMSFDALRGNVETELAADSAGEDFGCGCAYPEWVDDDVVVRSNGIAELLRRTAAAFPELRAELAALPMWRRVAVGDLQIAVVHGDPQSLAGWGLAQQSLDDPRHHRQVLRWFDEANVDVFACTHTCLPAFRSFRVAGRPVESSVVNNGSAGMPNFFDQRSGLITRLAVHPFEGPQRRFGVERGGVFVEAVDVDYDHRRWTRDFLRQWPAGSDAHASYWKRIIDGPEYPTALAYGPRSADRSVAIMSTGREHGQ